MSFKQLIGAYPGAFAPEVRERDCQCGEGWRDLLIEIIEDICLPYGTKIWYWKEKFGGLRVGVNNLPAEARDAFYAKLEKSREICEICGKPGKLREDTWIKTLCEDHAGGKPIYEY